MSVLKIERLGGVAGFGGPHLKSRGECALAELSAADQAAVESLFASAGKGKARGLPDQGKMRDGFSYRISRQTATGTAEVVVPESMVPAALVSSVKDTLE
jgi:hypothetical protein